MPISAKNAKIENWSNWKIKTIFLTSSSSWFQICKKIWKKFIFWRIFAKKTYKRSRNLSKFLFKKVALMCMLLHLSFKKNRSIRLKVWNLAFKGQYSLCHQLPSRFLTAVNSLDLDLSENMHYVADLHRPICFLFKIRNADFTV